MLRRAAEVLANTGPAFFETALAELMRMLHARLGTIARVEDGTAHTDVLRRDGQVVPNISVPIEGSPFGHVLSGPAVCCIPDGVASRFPEPWLRAVDAAGYIGSPIHDRDGKLVGLIGVFTAHDLRERVEAEAILRIFATRVAGEMQQRRMEGVLRQSEHRLFQMEKMDAIGQLAGGVAHDFNNVLTVILGYGGELLSGAAGEETAGHLTEMVAAAERAKQLTQQLLAFSRSQLLESRPIAIDDVVGSVQSLLERIIGEDVRLLVGAGGGRSAIHADPGQLSQVLLNLAVNARDAMPDGGTLTIETSRVHLAHDLERARGRAVPAGRYVTLMVRDTGHGMDDATVDRIFEPFFSTKGSHGTGLGLATVYGVVRQSGGFIDCSSSKGAGTTFTVYFPEIDAPAVVRELPEFGTGIARGQESILVVEDEAPVRHFLDTALTRRGFTTRSVESAAAALEILRDGWKPDLLLTDHVLPGGMNGAELARAAAAACPGLCVIVMSGYAKEPITGGAVPAHAFLQKPFTPDALCAKIREVIGRPAPA